MNKKNVPLIFAAALLIAAGVLVVGFLAPRRSTTRLDAREIRCAQNLKSIADAAVRFRLRSNGPPLQLAELLQFGLRLDETNCPSAPPNYLFDPSGSNFLLCPNHHDRRDGRPFRISSDLAVRVGANP